MIMKKIAGKLRSLPPVRKTLLILLPALAAAYLSAGWIAAKFIIVNLTPSMPGHLYLKVRGQPRTGDVILYCPAGRTRKILDTIGFTMPNAQCPDGKIGLIKQIAAMPGDQVSADGIRDMEVNGKALEGSRADPLTRLPPWKWEGTIPEGRFLLLGKTRDSFDSRYFGLLDTGGAASVLMEVF